MAKGGIRCPLQENRQLDKTGERLATTIPSPSSSRVKKRRNRDHPLHKQEPRKAAAEDPAVAWLLSRRDAELNNKPTKKLQPQKEYDYSHGCPAPHHSNPPPQQYYYSQSYPAPPQHSNPLPQQQQ